MNKTLRILNYEYSSIFQTVKEEHEAVSKNSDSVRSTCFSGLWHGVVMGQAKTKLHSCTSEWMDKATLDKYRVYFFQLYSPRYPKLFPPEVHVIISLWNQLDLNATVHKCKAQSIHFICLQTSHKF